MFTASSAACPASMSYVDSGAGQTMIATSAAFIPGTLQSVAIAVEGVTGTMMIHAMGTVELYVLDIEGSGVILQGANCLMNPGTHNLLSLAQMQLHPDVVVSMTNEAPLILHDSGYHIPIALENGTFVLPFAVLDLTDPRRIGAPVIQITVPGPYVPPTTRYPDGSIRWSATHRSQLPMAYADRKFCVPLRAFGFRAQVAAMADSVFIDSTTRPQARRSYNVNSTSAMEDLSTRFMGQSTDRLTQTVKVSYGLQPNAGKGTVRPNRFPAGTMERGKTPHVSKGIVHHLHESAVAESVFTDTFETDDKSYRYGQAFVDYKSRYGMVYPLQSRGQVPESFLQFCADCFTPRILIRDNIAENKGKAMGRACRTVLCQSGFSTPYDQRQDFAEGFIGTVCRLASFAMVYSGAPMFLWRYAILAAVFVYNITAGWYSTEELWATPYEIIYGEPFPDSSIVVPFGCAALILLPKHKRKKMGPRCVLVVFLHYATQHPTYTYCFWSPRTGKLLYRQDAIFLVDVFPLRWGSESSSCQDGALLIPYACERAPASVRQGGDVDLSFADWAGPTLPTFADHVSETQKEVLSPTGVFSPM